MSTDSNDSITPDGKLVSVNRFTGSSILLFFDQLLVAIGNWIYWLVISKISSTIEIGQATTIFSLALLVTTITQLGLEYPLLKRSSTHQHQILGTALVIEIAITMASIPLVIYVINNVYQEQLQQYTWIAVGMIIFSSIGFVARFALLGVSDVKRVLIIDIVGAGVKFVAGYALVSTGLGVFGVVMSILLNILFVTCAALFVVSKRFRFSLGNLGYVKEIIRDALANMPSKLSRILIFSLSIVLLASFGISNSDIGIFYLALMISVVTGGLTSSMAFMIIPPSSRSNTDLSSSSLRIGLSFTAPLIAALIVAPKAILSLIGPQYMPAEVILLVLSASILPSAITINTVSKFNNLNKPRKLISIGSLEIASFLVAFFFLVPHYGTLGAAFSTLIAFINSSILSLVWSERIAMRYVGISIIGILAGMLAGWIAGSVVGGNSHPFAQVLVAIGATLIVVIALKNTSIDEIGDMIKSIVNVRYGGGGSSNVRSKVEH
jgi:O-antigen/teichoic acid export membrane protein